MKAQRRDANEDDVVEALELMGYRVERVYVPLPYDLNVSKAGSPLCLRMEVKTQTGKLKDSQTEALDAGSIVVVRSPDEAVDAARQWL